MEAKYERSGRRENAEDAEIATEAKVDEEG